MADTIRRWECGCGSFRFAIYNHGVPDVYYCQECLQVYKRLAERFWSWGLVAEEGK